MGITIVSAPPDRDPRVADLLDRAFQRPNQESRLVTRIAREHPAFDPELALMALDGDRPVGWALFLPRTLRLRGSWVPMAISSPFAVLDGERGRGIGRALLERGRALCVERGLRGAVVLGGRAFFGAHGYAPAFRFHALRVRAEDLPPASDADWRSLESPDLPHLRPLFEDSYRGAPGCERRAHAALDWESAIPTGHCHVHVRDGRPVAHVRFRTDGLFAVRECSTLDAAATGALLAYLRFLAEAHRVEELEVHVPPTHRVARPLFHGGALSCTSAFGDEAQLAVFDWLGLAFDSAARWSRALSSVDARPLTIAVDGRRLRLAGTPKGLEAEDAPRGARHLEVPDGWGGSLATGHRSWRDLIDDDGVRAESSLDVAGWRAVRALFPPTEPCWPYAPVFEIADT